MTLFRTAATASIAGILLIGTMSGAQAQLGAATLGVFLNGAINHVGGLINSAANAGNIVVAGAGGQVLQALLAAKTAYADALDKTQSDLNAAQISLLNDLTSNIKTLETGTFAQIQQIADKGVIVSNAIPFSNKFPQTTRYTPYYVVPSESGTTLVTLFGNYFDSARDGYVPELEAAPAPIPASARNTTSISFIIPNTIFHSINNAITYNRLRVTVPYRERCWVISDCREEANFDILVVGLPPNPGRIRFHTSRPVMTRDTRDRTGPGRSQLSDHDDIPDPIADGKQWCENVTPGWQVDVKSVSLKVDDAEGDWIDKGNSSNIANACWNIATVHHGMGTSGKIRFHLTWREFRDHETRQPVNIDRDLIWSNSTGFTVPPRGTWTAEYLAFDGRIQSIASADFVNPYVRVQTAGSQVTFVTVP